ncbi:NarK family nitrate/nitrite MFS transporter [Rahnella selenatireducens]|uniref:NarK family nitrate/nitrite MFS transporter n=1 Tax=Rahnella selenatireducens TaxID=3389797 RepID=UPI003969441F
MSQTSAPSTEKPSRLLQDWRPEDPAFWEKTGHKVASRNLWISVPCLLLGFCVWMLFSLVSVNLNKVGFNFTTDQLFMLTAIPSVSGALLRVPYSFMIPLFGGRRWTALSTIFLVLPCVWLGFAVQDVSTSYNTFLVIALLCGFGGANFASSMSNISFFFPKSKQGGALGINGGLGNLGVSVMQLVAPLVISLGVFAAFSDKQTLANGADMWLQNAAWVWVPFLIIGTVAAWFGMNDLATSKASIRQQLPVLKRGHLWIMSVLYLATFGSFIGFSAGFAMLTKTQFPDVNIIQYAFFGPFIGALARSGGGMLSDRLGGIRVTLVNYIVMAIFAGLLFLTLPAGGVGGNFPAFFAVFMVLFLTAGLGSGSTYQMIAVIFRKLTTDQAKARGATDDEALREAVTDTAAALGFISSIGAIGGFFIPKAFGTSLALTGSPAGAMKVFLVFYVVCALITWLVYWRKLNKGFATKQVRK